MNDDLMFSEVGPDHCQYLLRTRAHAVATIKALPFGKTDDASDMNTEHQDENLCPVQDKLCNACIEITSTVKTMLDEAVLNGRMGAHHIALNYTLRDLQISATLGCHLCSIFEASMMMYIRDGKLTPFRLEAEALGNSWLYLDTYPTVMEEARCTLRLGMINREVISLSSMANGAYFCLRKSDGALMEDTRGILPAPDTSDDSVFELISRWLTTCNGSHSRCKNNTPAEANVPRRLLKLGETTVRVVENVDQNQYVCLSHCWGSQANVPHKLTTGGQMEPFAISDLPKTLRDAIHTTKRLGHRYLWIDCFCIIQGSKEDWIRESAVMRQIYAHSAFTIAALAAKDTHGGCFHSRNVLALQDLYTDDLIVKPMPSDGFWQLEVDGSPATESSPLQTRAWVIQERLASPRTLYYGAQGIYWECRCMQASETHTKQINATTENYKGMLSALQAATDASEQAEIDTSSYSTFFEHWRRLLGVYTPCALTYLSDKLIALSGITRDIEKHTGKIFVQGLWMSELATGLLWLHFFPTARGSRHVESGRIPNSPFPSWSWASMKGEIRYWMASGQVAWEPAIHITESGDEFLLCLTTWRREVGLTEEGDLYLHDNEWNTGDTMEEYSWANDEKEPQDIPMYILLIQRVSISETPWLRSAKCLVVRHAEDDMYARVGVVNIKYDRPRDDPFPLQNPITGKNDLILI